MIDRFIHLSIVHTCQHNIPYIVSFGESTKRSNITSICIRSTCLVGTFSKQFSQFDRSILSKHLNAGLLGWKFDGGNQVAVYFNHGKFWWRRIIVVSRATIGEDGNFLGGFWGSKSWLVANSIGFCSQHAVSCSLKCVQGLLLYLMKTWCLVMVDGSM